MGAKVTFRLYKACAGIDLANANASVNLTGAENVLARLAQQKNVAQ
jgi:hypothetical protein